MADALTGDLSRRVVVGVDGSLGSRVALEHAARRIGPQGSLLVANAITVLPEAIHNALSGIDDVRRDVARQLVEQQSDLAGVKAEWEVLEGRPAEALVEVARQRDADEIVVGARGLGRFAAALGSVSHALVGLSDRPVVVVPQAAADRTRRNGEGGPVVVVGYDGSAAAAAALAYGARRATGAGKLVVLFAFEPRLEGMQTPDFQRALTAYKAHGRELLQSLDERSDLEVELQTALLEGPPARSIVAAADTHDADEIVIGSRGFGALRGLLGSVSHAVLHEADRPVVVIPADALADSDRSG